MIFFVKLEGASTFESVVVGDKTESERVLVVQCIVLT